ncbi:HCNGP-domain-containing protein [Exidia glandulosa HHB12029]|uniref:HCNGP-domain-containing protein n=1 Tax=Exidia glandulosa HHB12029 TaxID=1314781 RepID=A0A165MSY2_EXIGL|nr:HCNGP-domain-containing protein [Exidia glandulosa HHB12029]
MKGLVAYGGDDESDHDEPSTSSATDRISGNGTRLSVGGHTGKAATIIKRSTHSKATIRARSPSNSPEVAPVTVADQGHSQATASTSAVQDEDELTRLRRLLKPLPIPGQDDYGIPPPPSGTPSATLTAKLAQFAALKSSQNKHFNDALMANRSFRNPHLYKSLVEFVDVDETASNFSKDVWDPNDVRPEWFAAQIGARSKLIHDVVALLYSCARSLGDLSFHAR